MLPLLYHLERLEGEEEDEEATDLDNDETGQVKNDGKRNVSTENYIAWGILQVSAKYKSETTKLLSNTKFILILSENYLLRHYSIFAYRYSGP